MKSNAIVKSLRRILDLDDKGKKKDALRKVLDKLKKNQIKLKKKLEDAKGGKERKRLAASLKVNRVHRRKGLKALRKLGRKE